MAPELNTNLYRDTYWGHFRSHHPLMVENRNLFAGQYRDISYVKRRPRYLTRLVEDHELHADHVEYYKVGDGEYVIIMTSHAEVPKPWMKIPPLYSRSEPQYMLRVLHGANCDELCRDPNCSYPGMDVNDIPSACNRYPHMYCGDRGVIC